MSSDLNGLYKDIHSFAFTTSAKFIIKTSHKIKKFKSLFGQINGLFFTLDWSENEKTNKKNKLNHIAVCHRYIYTGNKNRSCSKAVPGERHNHFMCDNENQRVMVVCFQMCGTDEGFSTNLFRHKAHHAEEASLLEKSGKVFQAHVLRPLEKDK